ncbi:lipopolysaccharide biosynthesis protein [Variovorax sp. V213]|uniref:lipopolysaccharide biosynthesis protein n=1 Tax=Variovorax sp. V213 TaxID=3065955 RepID=UPI0034E86A9F
MKSTSLQIIGGQALWALTQALVILLLARQAGGVELIGTFTLALAIFTPLCLVGGLNLRNLIAIDEGKRIDIAAALILRAIVVVVALAITVVALQCTGNLNSQWLIVVALLATRALDHVSDVAAGFYQNNNRLGKIGTSFFARGCASFLPLIAIWSLGGGLGWAAVASFLTTLAAVIVFDLISIRKIKEINKDKGNPKIGVLFKALMPSLSASLFPFFDSLHSNSLRYVVFFLFSSSVLGLVGIAQTLFAPVQLLISALGYSYLPKMRMLVKAGDRDKIISLVREGSLQGLLPTAAFLILSLIVPESLLRVAFGSVDLNGLREALYMVSIAMLFFGVTGYLAQSVLAMRQERYYLLSPLIGSLSFFALTAVFYSFEPKIELIFVGILFASSFFSRMVCNLMGLNSKLGSQA